MNVTSGPAQSPFLPGCSATRRVQLSWAERRPVPRAGTYMGIQVLWLQFQRPGTPIWGKIARGERAPGRCPLTPFTNVLAHRDIHRHFLQATMMAVLTAPVQSPLMSLPRHVAPNASGRDLLPRS